MNEWLLPVELVYPWSLWEGTGPEALMIYTFAFVLCICLFCVYSCYFPCPIEGRPIWGRGSARPLVSIVGNPGMTLERMIHNTCSEREGKLATSGQVPGCATHQATCSGPGGLPEQHHTLACYWQMPSFLPRSASEAWPHLTHLWAVQASQWVLNPCEQEHCQIQLRSLAKESLEKLSLIKQRPLY